MIIYIVQDKDDQMYGASLSKETAEKEAEDFNTILKRQELFVNEYEIFHNKFTLFD